METQKVIEFWAGNPTVQLIHGKLEILTFCDRVEETVKFLDQLKNLVDVQKCRYLCCFDVPIYMSAIEFCEFISPKGNIIEHIRVLKGTS
jgi:hypothetical protein